MFYDREDEQQKLFALLKMEPSLVYFVYGPINSGKTNLMNRVLQNLPEPMLPFYVDLRRRNVSSSDDFLNTLFRIDRKSTFKSIREYAREVLKDGADIVKQTTGIPVPVKIFDLLFRTEEKGEDVFFYLEEFFATLVHEKKLKPVFVLDELQMLKDIVNSKGSPLLDNLFNFFVGMTKATHLCHCVAVTSDSVFIEQIYGNARLEGRSQYILVDDLDKTRSFEIYEKFGFEDKELVWSYISGKIGDMTVLYSLLQEGRSLGEGLKTMLRMAVNRLKLIEAHLLHDDEQQHSNIMDLLFQVGKQGSVPFEPKAMQRAVYFWVDENVLFLEPVNGIVKAQGQLTQRAINDFERNQSGS